jgi:dihydroxyacetone kinase
MSKKFINHPDDCVDEALEGLVMTHLGLRILGEQRVIVHESVRRPFLKRISVYTFVATPH